MNDVRKQALWRLSLALGIMAAVGRYLWGLDHGATPIIPLPAGAYSAFLLPSFLVFVRSVPPIFTGRALPKGWPHQTSKPFGEK